jgi:DNA-binding beta-propeller fold protein YncE
MVLPTLLCVACGQVYRPVVIPCTGASGLPGCPVETPPTPGNFHTVFAISDNVPGAPGGALQIDAGGDAIIAETPSSQVSAPNLGEYPTHAALTTNDARMFVASAGSVGGGLDIVSAFSPAFQSTTATGFGAINTINLPSQIANITAISEAGNLVTVTLSTPLIVPAGYWIVIAGVVIPACVSPCNPIPQNAYNGGFAISSITGTSLTYMNTNGGLPALSSGGTATVPPQPVFLGSTQGSAMYAANYNANSVVAINTSLNLVTNSAAVGVHPVSLAGTPNGFKLYVANQGDNTVSSLNTTDLSSNVVTGFTGISPVWVVARGDSQKVYVLTEGDGQLVTIDTATDTVTGSLSVGAGANFVFFDPILNRLYITNPVTSTVYVLSDTGGANDTPILLTTIPFTAGSAPCPNGCSPTSVTALLDGSRFYVASYQLASSACPDPTVTGACVIPSLTVFDANSMTPKITPALQLLTWAPPLTPPITTWPFATNQFAVPQVTACASPVFPALYTPGATRFRVFTTSASDSSRVYVSMCDAGAIAVINTTNSNNNNNNPGGIVADTLAVDLLAAFGAGPVLSTGQPAPQSPIFMLPGQ